MLCVMLNLGCRAVARPGKQGKRKRSDYWESLSGWKAVDSGDVLLGAEEGGFAGLEVIDDPALLSGLGLDGGAAATAARNEAGSKQNNNNKNKKQKQPSTSAAAKPSAAAAAGARSDVGGAKPAAVREQTYDSDDEHGPRKKVKRGSRARRAEKAEKAALAAAATAGGGQGRSSERLQPASGVIIVPDQAQPVDDLTTLQARVAALEAENAALKGGEAKQRKLDAAKPGMQPQPKQHQRQKQQDKPAATEPAGKKKGKKAKTAAAAAANGSADADAAKVEAEAAAAAAAQAAASLDMSAWAEFELHPLIESALAQLGFARPTAIQSMCLTPAIRDYRDIIGAAQTGSGKTLAFGLPIMQRVMQLKEAEAVAAAAAAAAVAAEHDGNGAGATEEHETTDADPASYGGHATAAGEGAGGSSAGANASSRAVGAGSRKHPAPRSSSGALRALILAPTRELALQVSAHLAAIGRVCGVRVAPIVGGLAAEKQQRLLRACPEVVVATPGRLWDLMRQGQPHLTQLSRLSFLVLDEADRMVQQGLYQELINILDLIPRRPGAAKLAKQPNQNQQQQQRRGRAAGTQKQQQDLDGAAITEGGGADGSPGDAEAALHVGNDEDAGGVTGSDDADVDADVDADMDADEDAEAGTDEPSSDVGEDVGGSEEPGDAAAASDEDEAGPSDAAGARERRRTPRAATAEQLAAAAPPEGWEEDGEGAAAAAPQQPLQTFVFSATLTLPLLLRKRLRKGGGGSGGGSATLDNLMNRITFRGDPKIVDLTTERKLSDTVEEAYIDCVDTERDAHLYYLLACHPGRTLVFVNAVTAIRRVAALLRLLGLPAHSLHAQQQQRQRLKALDRFRSSDQGVLVATDVAARGLDIAGVQTVVHYQLPASADTYIHRAGRTARQGAAGISIALVTPKEAPRFAALSRALGRPLPPAFPVNTSIMKDVYARVKLAISLDEIERRQRKHKASETWVKSNAELLDLDYSEPGTDDEDVDGLKRSSKREAALAARLRQQLAVQLSKPLQQRISRKYFTGGTVAVGGRSADAAAADAEAAGAAGNVVHSVAMAARMTAVKSGVEPAAPVYPEQQKLQQLAKKNGKQKQQKASKQRKAEPARPLLLSRNELKRRGHARGMVVIPAAFGRDAQTPGSFSLAAAGMK